MGRKKRDLTGQDFGSLKVIAEAGSDKWGNALWKCKCECGKEPVVAAHSMVSGKTKTCGHRYSYSNSYKMSDDGGYMIGIFSNGDEFLFDIVDYEMVKAYTWYQVAGYATALGGHKTTLLHRLLMNNPKGLQVDHINLDRSDNRRSNLRLATNKENQRNRGITKNNTSGAKGVWLRSKYNDYRASIKVDGRSIHIGYYPTFIEASEAYDRMADHYFGEFAWLNNLREKTPELNAGVFASAAK